MKFSVFFVISLLAVACSLQGQTQPVKINITLESYVQSSVEQKMEKWLQKNEHESVKDYEARVSDTNKTAVRKRFEEEATIRYKELFAKNVNPENTLAEINWQLPSSSSSEVEQKDLRIQACVKSKTQIKSVSVEINEQTTRGVSAVVNDGCEHAVNQVVTLNEGMNTIKISVENEAGKSVSDTRYVNYQANTPERTPATGKRLALVVGNAAYSVSPLANPANDAADVAAKLKKLGFEVILLTDKTKKQIEQALDYFNNNTKGYDVALFFYAGHAIQYRGKNYLIPVDADMREEGDIEYECTPIDRVLAKMEDSGYKLKIVALDACRNNPFARSWRSFSNTGGLSFMNAPVGTFIAYSTAPNEVAQDGKGRNSPYTAELLKKLDVKCLKIEDLFKQVRESVLKKTNGRQVPWDQSSIVGEFYFNVCEM